MSWLSAEMILIGLEISCSLHNTQSPAKPSLPANTDWYSPVIGKHLHGTRSWLSQMMAQSNIVDGRIMAQAEAVLLLGLVYGALVNSIPTPNTSRHISFHGMYTSTRQFH